MRRARWSCCGAQNFCAALRRTLEILTAATRSFRFIRHRRRSIHSPHPAAMVRSLSCGGTHGCRPTERFVEADGPVRPARDTQHFCRAGPCALPGRYGARPARARQSPAPTDDLQISVDGPMWALAPTHNNRRGRGRPRGSPLRGAGSNGLPQPVTSVTGFAMTGIIARGTVQDRAAGEYAQDRFGSSGRPTPTHVYR